jgi:hypothetical protein
MLKQHRLFDVNCSSIIQTLTVGFGISPNQSQMGVADYTAGRELRPAPKKIFMLYVNNLLPSFATQLCKANFFLLDIYNCLNIFGAYLFYSFLQG